MNIHDQVLKTLKNHKLCTSGGVAHLLNVPRFTVLRAMSDLIKSGDVRQQKGRVVDGWPEPKYRGYKLGKTMFTQQALFE